VTFRSDESATVTPYGASVVAVAAAYVVSSLIVLCAPFGSAASTTRT
jgi:DNA-binding transcriptional regulator PaaX